MSVDGITSAYNTTMQQLLDAHAPVKVRRIPSRTDPEWYNMDIREAKQRRRRAERCWRQTRLTVHRELYMQERGALNRCIRQAKKDYYTSKIDSMQKDPKKLFGVINNLLGRCRTLTLPSDASSDDFNNFFLTKVRDIRASIGHVDSVECPPLTEAVVNNWEPITTDELLKVLKSVAVKSCHLDPIPTSLLLNCLDPIIPVILDIVNKSLSEAKMPDAYKTALVVPLLKKPTLDAQVLKNYRPVSNLPFLSKVIEKVIATQLQHHLSTNNLLEEYQSAYRPHHSTESALVRVQHDILSVLGSRKAVLLVLVDLSAAFDTVDHDLLLDILWSLGIRTSALQWFASYLCDRHQFVQIRATKSATRHVPWGVPQGSVLGPLLFTIYTASLGKLLSSLDMQYHFYADDTQVYLSFSPESVVATANRLESCLDQVRLWMARHCLKMNGEKTEALLITSRRLQEAVSCPVLHIGDNNITPKEAVRNIGVIIDSHLSLEEHISNVCRVAQFHIFNIGRIRRYLSQSAAEQFVHAFITSRLDYCNSLLGGLPAHSINRLQRLQNIAARIVTLTGRREHITPVLKALHWLPVCKRIDFKTLLLVYKAYHQIAPSYLQELIVPYIPTRNLRSSSHHLLVVPRHRSALHQRAFGVRGPLLWNALPAELRAAPSLCVFKKNLKTYLFNEFYS